MGDLVSMGPDVLSATIRMAVPLLLVAIAELFSERAGLVNIGLDGLMSIGALFGFLAGYYTGNAWVGLAVGMVAGVLFNLIYALCTVTLCVDQVVTGMALNILAPAVATFVYKVAFGDSSTLVQGTQMAVAGIPLLSGIPVVGPAFFQQTPLAYFAYLLVPLSAVFFGHFRAGLSFRSVGENPHAAETLGIDVLKTKYVACVICGALAGLGGAFLTLCYTSTYAEGIVAGRGFIALSAVIFGRWRSPGVLCACLLFGFCDALQIVLQIHAQGIPYQFFQMIPYVVTLVVLVFFGSGRAGPKANGRPYFREER
ncbi:ABC transporter permease [Thermophilibacter immobilis]|uniref:ABC transporter permease n=1 Tax=Thermophilibacter immobilis TaxID=2779519 RepID=A0A7S7M7V4_9ACTN|nr:ABC transporter permease [Thermophilibacter immobilis]QOY60253.1 ABC transporter permease [Thermophilibacter immobilis]